MLEDTDARRFHLRGFSLVELMLVLFILTVLLVVSAGSFLQLSVNLALTEAGDRVAAALREGRHLAVARSDAVEVRFYHPIDPTMNGAPPVTAVQIVRQSSDGSYEAGVSIAFSEEIVICVDSEWSSLFARDDTTSMLLRGKGGSLYPVNPEASYTAFRFHPDGSTSLPMGKWYFSLVFRKDLEDLEAARNFYTIQVDPVLGRVEVFRP